MAKINDKMREMIESQLGYISTVSEEGEPNVGPKRSLRLYDDETLIYNENTGKQTLKNINDNGKASVAFVNWEKLDGYRFYGEATSYTEGEYYDTCVEWAKGKMGVPKAAVVIKIKRTYTLKVGLKAGDLIERDDK